MKIYNITHNDGDGIGCNLVLQYKYGRGNVVSERCTYDNVNGVLYNLLKSGDYKKYDMIYITDVSISEKMAEWVNKDFSKIVKLIDHHQTALWMNKYEWAYVKEFDDNGIKISATKILYEIEEINNNVLKDIVNCINDYDTWYFVENGNIKAKQINDLLYMVGFDEMVDIIWKQLYTNNAIFELDEKYKFLLEIREREYKYYLESSNKNITKAKYKNLKVGIVIAERFISELGNDLAKLNPDLDFIAILNMRSALSLRGVKDDVNLGVIAKEIGSIINMSGGGHPKASAISMTNEYRLKFLSNLFEIVEQ